MIWEIALATYGTGILVAALALIYRVLPRKLGMVLATIETELELIAEIRHLMADLGSRDPQLSEHMELGLIQLDGWERDLTRNAKAIRELRLLGLVRKGTPDA
jgi:hypothetical protein